MKCESCPALERTSYEYGEYECAAGVPEDGKMKTDEGCRYSLKRIQSRMDHIADIKARQYDGIGNFFETECDLDDAMREAIAEAFKQIAYPGENLAIAFKDDGGGLHEIGDWERELPNALRNCYLEAEKGVQKKWCERCRYRNRYQKCNCCSRNRSMIDMFAEDKTKGSDET